MEEIQTSSSNMLPFPAEPQRQERGFWTRCEFPRTSQTRRVYLKTNPATTRSLILPFTCLVCSCLTLPAYVWALTNSKQAEFPSDLHITLVKICPWTPDFYNEPEIFYCISDSHDRKQHNETLTHTHTPQSRGLKQQQLFSWHRAGALRFLEQVDYLTST